MNQIRKRLTYANVMSSIAVFLVLGGAAFAAVKLPKNSVGTKQLKNNAVTAAKIKNNAVTAGKLATGAVDGTKLADGSVANSKLADNAVTTGKLADNAVTTGKIANDAVTGEKVKESSLGQVPSAANATNAANSAALGGIAADNYAQRMFARVSYTSSTESLIAASPGISAGSETSLGFPTLVFPRSMEDCAIVGSANSGAGTQIVRRSTGIGPGATVQFAIKDDTNASVRADFEVIAVC